MKANKRSQTKTTTTAEASLVAEGYANAPTPEEVSQRAYQNYESEGSRHGSDVEHWLAAEAGLLAERNF